MVNAEQLATDSRQRENEAQHPGKVDQRQTMAFTVPAEKGDHLVGMHDFRTKHGFVPLNQFIAPWRLDDPVSDVLGGADRRFCVHGSNPLG